MSPSSLYGITGPQLSNPSCLERYGGNTLPREYGVMALGSQRNWGRGHPCGIKYRAVSGILTPI